MKVSPTLFLLLICNLRIHGYGSARRFGLATSSNQGLLYGVVQGGPLSKANSGLRYLDPLMPTPCSLRCGTPHVVWLLQWFYRLIVHEQGASSLHMPAVCRVSWPWDRNDQRLGKVCVNDNDLLCKFGLMISILFSRFMTVAKLTS